MRQTRRDFIQSVGSLTIGFWLPANLTRHAQASSLPNTESLPGPTWPDPQQQLPGDLSRNPRINAWLEILADGRVRILTGKIELGQGIGTAVAQMAAEELDMEMNTVEVLLAETGRTPDEGYTAGSNSIEMSAIAIRYAAAAARRRLLQLAAQKWSVPADTLQFAHGRITDPANHRSLTLDLLLDGRQITDEVHLPVPLKPKNTHRLVGKSIPRDDVKRIVTGQPVYVHDLGFPSMLHARILHPPRYGAKLEQTNEAAVKTKFPQTTLVIDGSFLAVLAPTEYQAMKAHQLLAANTRWTGPLLPKLEPGALAAYIKTLPSKQETVAEKGDISTMPAAGTLKASYFKPYIMHGALGPSCAVAFFDNGNLDVWTHSQGVYPLRETLAGLLHLPEEKIHVKGVPGAGCYGHNGADDAAADAALLAMATPGRHIRVQWSREDEHGWEPYGSAMVMDLEAALDANGKITHWKYGLWSDTHGARPGGNPANLLPARYIAKPFTAKPSGFSGGANRNAQPHYAIPHQLVQANFFEGPLRTSSLRSLGAYANLFAIESFMDELAEQAGRDPIEFRLQNLDDPRAKDVLLRLQKLTAANPAPDPNPASDPTPSPAAPEYKTATGIAFSRYKDNGTYCAVAAQVAIGSTGIPTVKKMWAVVDAGEVINLDGITNQIEGGMIQSASWTLLEQVRFDENGITSRQWATYPVLHIDQTPRVEVTVIDRPDQPPMGAGEAAQGPAAAAIVNAIHKACGRRIRNLPVGKLSLPSSPESPIQKATNANSK